MSNNEKLALNQVSYDKDMVFIDIRNPYKPKYNYTASLKKDATIFQLKEHLFANYPSNPQIAEQRLIYQGRKLLDDEFIKHIIDNNSDQRQIFHLAVRNSIPRSVSAPVGNDSIQSSEKKILKAATPLKNQVQPQQQVKTPVMKAVIPQSPIPIMSQATRIPFESKMLENKVVEKKEEKREEKKRKEEEVKKEDTTNKKIEKIGGVDVTKYNLSSEQLEQLRIFYAQQVEYNKNIYTIDEINTEIDSKNNTNDVKQAEAVVANEAEAEPVIPPVDEEKKQGDQPRRWRDYIDFKIAFNAALMVVLFAWDEEPKKFYMFVAAAVFIYLVRVGVISDIFAALKRRRIANNPNHADISNNNRPAVHRPRRNLGYISIAERMIVGFFASFHPAWRPLQVIADNADNQQQQARADQHEHQD